MAIADLCDYLIPHGGNRGRMAAPNRMIFGKVPKGGGIFNPKIYVADFGNFKQGFLSMKLIQKSKFKV